MIIKAENPCMKFLRHQMHHEHFADIYSSAQTIYAAPTTDISQATDDYFSHRLYRRYVLTPSRDITFTLAAIGDGIDKVPPGYDVYIFNNSEFEIDLAGANTTLGPRENIRLLATNTTWQRYYRVPTIPSVLVNAGDPSSDPSYYDGDIYIDKSTGVIWTYADGEWGSISSGGSIVSISVSGGSTGLTTTGGPIMRYGTVTLAGTLNAAHGGTGQTTYAPGDLICASGATALTKIPAVAAGNALLSAGTSIMPTWGKIDLSIHTTGILSATAGGTGQIAYTPGDILYADSTTTLAKLSGVSTGNALVSGGIGIAPTWGKIGLSTHTTGVLSASNGGTGQSTYIAGDILYADSATTLAKLPGVALGNTLISAGVGVPPVWGKIDLSTHTTGILSASNGGTGQSAFTPGDILYADSTTTISKLSDVITGNALISGGIGVPPTWGKINLSTHITGVLSATNGGTGQSTFTPGDIIYADSTTTLAKLSGVATGNAIISGGVGIPPTWGKINLSTHTTGVLPAVAGGTGQSTYSPGDIIYADSTTTISKLSSVATGNALVSGGVSTAPAWGKIGLSTHVVGVLPADNGGTGINIYNPGDIIYADSTTTLNKLSSVGTGNALVSGGVNVPPIWGKINLSTHVVGVLPAGNGGTGQSTYTPGDILYADSTTTLAKLSGVAVGNALISGGVSTAPTWGKINLSTHIIGILSTANGGTNSSAALNNNRVMISAGGSIVESAAATNGQLLIGNTGAAPVWAGLTAGDNITITNSPGGITINSRKTLAAVAGYSAPPTGTTFTLLTATFPAGTFGYTGLLPTGLWLDAVGRGNGGLAATGNIQMFLENLTAGTSTTNNMGAAGALTGTFPIGATARLLFDQTAGGIYLYGWNAGTSVGVGSATGNFLTCNPATDQIRITWSMVLGANASSVLLFGATAWFA